MKITSFASEIQFKCWFI